MSFFMDSAISLSSKLLECVYIIIGLITIYAGVKNLLDKENPARYGTFVFWTAFGIVCALGHWLPTRVSGLRAADQDQRSGGGRCRRYHLYHPVNGLFEGQPPFYVSQGFRAFPVHDGTALYAAAAAGLTGRRVHGRRRR